jgi:hypothetical protein
VPRVTYLQTNFTAGELSPRLRGRVDIARYQNGAAKVRNGLPLIHGGVQRRYGMRYVARAKSGSVRCRLVPFVFSRDQSYMLEFGNLYMRVYTNGAQVEASPGVPYEIVTPYTTAMLSQLDYAQGADTMFICHPDVPVQRLRRFADASWDLSAVPWVFEPFDEQGHIGTMGLTLSAATVGAGRAFIAASARFLASDVGRTITAGPGVALVTGVSSSTAVTCTIQVAFTSTSIAANAWRIEGSPQATVTPSAATPLGASITMSASADAWRDPEDVGKVVRINGGIVRITGCTSPTIVSGRIETALSAAVAAPANAWSLESTVWTAANGYPRAVTFHEQRLVLAGSRRYPQTVWGSAPNESLNFLLGVADDDAFAFEVASEQINPIAYLSSIGQLAVLTYGGELALYGGTDKPITPTNVQVKPQSALGCELVKPVRVGQEIVFVQRSGRKVRAMGARSDSIEGYRAEDVSLLAEHITSPEITQLAYQQERDPFVWMVRADGALVTCTLDRAQDVVAWADHITDGLVESVAVIPSGDTEQVWVAVQRTINSVVVRSIERLDETLRTDSARTATSGPGTATWTGAGHLEGKVVKVVADGVLMPQQTVTGGAFTLPRPAFAIEYGLPYETRIELLTPELQGAGSAQASQMRTHELTLRVLETTGAIVNGDQTIFRKLGEDVLDTPPPSITGDVRINVLGWERGQSPIVITQPDPLPFHLLAAIRRFTWNEG